MADTIETSVLIEQVDVDLKNKIKKEISVAARQIFNKDTFLDDYDNKTNTGGYYKYIQNLDSLNEEYYIALTQTYDVATAITSEGISAVDTLIPPYENATQFRVSDMLNYRAAVTTKCNETYTKVKQAATLQQYLATIDALDTSLTTCVTYLNKQDNFEKLNWVVNE